jgi:hypothetical protein
MNEQIAKLNVVIAELNLVTAKLAGNAPPASLASLLDQAKVDLAEATRSIIGQNPMTGDTN